MNISESEARKKGYMGYVGPAGQYDFKGATQFHLLCTLGLRSHHCLLDFGCGSLRAGRFFISYLNEGLYFGIEPNKWLIEAAINEQIGQDLINIKKPQFDHNSDFVTNVFSLKFDFIIAQSIFSHAGSNLINIALKNFKDSLKSNGLIAVTFVEGDKDFNGEGWIYPGSVKYRRSTIKQFAKEAGLFSIRIPWYHPNQTWYLLANKKNRLPDQTMFPYLSGAVLFNKKFGKSTERKTLGEPNTEELKNLIGTFREDVSLRLDSFKQDLDQIDSRLKAIENHPASSNDVNL